MLVGYPGERQVPPPYRHRDKIHPKSTRRLSRKMRQLAVEPRSLRDQTTGGANWKAPKFEANSRLGAQL